MTLASVPAEPGQDRLLTSPLGEVSFHRMEDGSLWISRFQPAAAARAMPPLDLLRSLIELVREEAGLPRAA